MTMITYANRNKSSYGWLGVTVADVDDATAAKIGLPLAKGLLVLEVEEGSPAERCGIDMGDVMLRYDGKVLENREYLPNMVAGTATGKRVPVTVWRDGREQDIAVTIGKQANEGVAAAIECRVNAMFAALTHEENRLPDVWFGLCAVIKSGFFRHNDAYADDQKVEMMQTINSTTGMLRHMLRDIAWKESADGRIAQDEAIESEVREKIKAMKQLFAQSGENDTGDDRVEHDARKIWNKLPRDVNENPLLYNTVREKMPLWQIRLADEELDFRDVLFGACLRVAEDVAKEGLNIEVTAVDAVRDRVESKIDSVIEEYLLKGRISQKNLAKSREEDEYYRDVYGSSARH